MSGENIGKCLQALRSAQSDNERFAALMMVTKVLKAEDCDEETRRDILDAMGFRFLTRLMKTTSVPEGCPTSIYKSIALSILSSFSQDPQVVSNPEIKKQVTVLNEVVLGNISGDDADTMLSDCYDCLRGMMLSPISRQYLVEGGVQQALVEVIVSKEKGHEKASEVLLELLRRERSQVWRKYAGEAQKLLCWLVAEFTHKQDASKFEVGDILTVVLSTVDQIQMEEDQEVLWVDDLVKELNGIIRSKLDDRLRDSVLGLVSSLITSQGVMCVLPPYTDDLKLLLLVTHMACIEIRMVLEDGRLEQIQKKSGVVCSCYGILENIIGHMTTGMSMGLNEKQILQLHSAMMGAFNSVIFFLSQVEQQQLHMERSSLLVTASVRVLGAWLAEETSALREEIYKLLPFLIQICKDQINPSPDVDTMCKISHLNINGSSEHSDGQASCTASSIGQDVGQSDELEGSSEADVGQSETKKQQQTGSEAVAACGRESPTGSDSLKTTKQNKRKNKKRKSNNKSELKKPDDNKKDGIVNTPTTKSMNQVDRQAHEATTDISTDTTKSTGANSEYNNQCPNLQMVNTSTLNKTEKEDMDISEGESAGMKNSNTEMDNSENKNSRCVSFDVSDISGDKDSASCKEADSTLSSASKDESRNEHVDLVKFLLPAMCHLTAEEKPREILIRQNVPDLLVMYFQRQMQYYLQHRHNTDLRDTLASLCGIFLNMTVTEPGFASSHYSFHQLLSSILTYLTTTAQDPDLLVLSANIVTLGLMLLRHQSKRTDLSSDSRDQFLAGSISFMSKAHSRVKRKPPMLAVSDCYRAVWEDISELWYLSMQGLSALIPVYADLPKLLMKSGWIPAIVRILLEVQGAGVDSDAQSAILSMLTTLSLNDMSAKRIIREKGGIELAQMYLCEDLQNALTTS